jgi:D-xylose transport system substrate-binding protein
MFKKIFNYLLVSMLISSLFLTGCSIIETGSTGNVDSKNDKKDDKIVIGFSVGTSKQERWQREIEMAREFADENGFELMVQSAEEDADKQIRQVENMITKGIDVLLISALDSESSGSVVATAHDAGIPVVAYDRLVKNGDVDYYVTFDTVKVGELQAKSLVEKYPKGNYIWLLGGPEDNNAHLLKEGQEKVLKPLIDKGDIKIVTQQWAKGWNPEEALKHTENGLTSAKNDVVAVLASNDGTAGGAVQALEAQGLAGKVGVSGQDADIAAVQRIVEGKQTSTIYKPIKELNQKAMELVYSLAKGEDVLANKMATGKVDNAYKDVPSVFVDVMEVTKDNMVDTVIKDGFHKFEEVYKNVPVDQRPAVK